MGRAPALPQPMPAALSRDLTSKLSLRVAGVVMLLLLLLGIYFDVFLRSSFLDATNERMRHAAQRLVFNLEEVELDLRQGADLAGNDERLIASVELINKYQDASNYNRFLIDEEKKALAQAMLDRVKFSFNSNIAIYSQAGDLVAYAQRRSDGFHLGYLTQAGGQARLLERHEDAADYRETKDLEGLGLSHVSYYSAEELQRGTVITYHRLGEDMVVRAHQNVIEKVSRRSSGQLEISRAMGAGYFQQMSEQMDIGIRLDFEAPAHAQLVLLDGRRTINHVQAQAIGEQYLSVLQKPLIGGPAYIAFTLDRASHSSLVNQNRWRFVILLALLSLAMLMWMRYIARAHLARPLGVLMEQIGQVERGHYEGGAAVHTGDELETISYSVRQLAAAVHDREDSLERARHEQEFLSNHDALTGLPNRRFFADRLEHALDVTRRNQSQLAVLFLDLDQFKLVNDTLGHDIGDALLVQVGQRLSRALRSSDTLARIGGDEFNVLLEGVESLAEVEVVVRKFNALFHEPFQCKGHTLTTTVSIGVATYPRDGSDSVTLQKHADLAVYRAKALGRDNFSFFSEELSRDARQRAETIAAIAAALEADDQFTMVYQPKCNVLTGRMASAEALIRWNRPGVGNVPPTQFIPLSEETGQILRIGDWAIERVCRDIATLRARGIALDHVSVNVSNVQLHGHAVIDVLRQSVARHGLQPSMIELEITESYIAQDTRDAIAALHQFRDAGFQLAIDDFGTGYSSMSYLQRLPFTRLKIDKSFVDGLPGNGDSASITRAIIGLARNFGLSITAEGVEREDQHSFLCAEGCHEIQGYVYARPMPLDEVERFHRAEAQRIGSHPVPPAA